MAVGSGSWFCLFLFAPPPPILKNHSTLLGSKMLVSALVICFSKHLNVNIWLQLWSGGAVLFWAMITGASCHITTYKICLCKKKKKERAAVMLYLVIYDHFLCFETSLSYFWLPAHYWLWQWLLVRGIYVPLQRVDLKTCFSTITRLNVY